MKATEWSFTCYEALRPTLAKETISREINHLGVETPTRSIPATITVHQTFTPVELPSGSHLIWAFMDREGSDTGPPVAWPDRQGIPCGAWRHAIHSLCFSGNTNTAEIDERWKDFDVRKKETFHAAEQVVFVSPRERTADSNA